jgi:voltage-gated potassium channel
MPLPKFQPGRRSNPLWRRLELVALLATIPAFYLAARGEQRILTAFLYGAAALASFGVAWHASRHRRGGSAGIRASVRLNGTLVIGLVLCAVLPGGDGLDVILVRLGTALLVVLRAGDSIRPWFWRDDLPRLLALAAASMALCGLGFWWLEPTAHTFGDGVWLAFTTAATVGYGDIVPSTPASKIFAVFVVFLGFTVLSLVTASVAAMWVQTEERKLERTMLRDLHEELRLVHKAIDELRSGRVAAEVETRVDCISP